MAFRTFRFQLTLRVLFLLVTLTAFAFVFARTEFLFNQIILLSLVVIQVTSLMRFVSYTDREMTKLLLAIKHKDFPTSFKGKTGRAFNEMQQASADIMEAFKKISVEKEAQFRFLQTIVDYLDIGIIAIKEKTEIALINKAAQETLKVPAVSYWKQIQQLAPPFAGKIDRMEDNEKELIELKIKENPLQMSTHLSGIKILDDHYQVITFQDIKSEIEQKEIEAWHKLIRVLTHEIMNSVTPIASLTETMIMFMEKEDGLPKPVSELGEENMEDIRFSLQTIKNRSKGLLHFVEDYRTLTRIRPLSLEQVKVDALLKEIQQLFLPETEKQKAVLTIDVQDNFYIRCDAKLIAQVLINLLKNALHAAKTTQNPSIHLLAYPKGPEKLIEVRDNGCGIDENKIDQVFIPFFSTKEEGSGIGLSLSRQIMKKHKGELTVRSVKGKGAQFFLTFRE